MTDRSRDWLRPAERDLEEAAAARTAGRHEWACFAAHQSADKAVKALHLHLGQEAGGHVVAQLLTELPPGVTVPADLLHQAQVLDNFYIPTRYPNAHPAGAPFEHCGPLQSEMGIRYAGAILAFVRAAMAGP
jgi:HEPN domain-containing protein